MTGIRCQYKLHCFSQTSLLHSQHWRLIYHLWNPACHIQILLTVVLECLPELLNAQQQLIPTWYIHLISHCCFSANFISPTPHYLPRSIFGQNLLNFNQFSLLFLTLRVSNILVLKNYKCRCHNVYTLYYTAQIQKIFLSDTNLYLHTVVRINICNLSSLQ